MGALPRVSTLCLSKSICRLITVQVLTLDLIVVGNLTSLIVPAAAVGALGYGYMWWKVRDIFHSFTCLG